EPEVSTEGRRLVRKELSLVLYWRSVREPDSRICATHPGARHTINTRVAGTRGNSHPQSPDPGTTPGARAGKRHGKGQGGPSPRSERGTCGSSRSEGADFGTSLGVGAGNRCSQGQGGPCFRSGEGWVLPQIGR